MHISLGRTGPCGFGRRKSKQALRDYKKVQIQLENLETSVRDRCKKEFTGEETHLPNDTYIFSLLLCIWICIILFIVFWRKPTCISSFIC